VEVNALCLSVFGLFGFPKVTYTPRRGVIKNFFQNFLNNFTIFLISVFIRVHLSSCVDTPRPLFKAFIDLRIQGLLNFPPPQEQ
jgi:hypothetical protein